MDMQQNKYQGNKNEVVKLEVASKTKLIAVGENNSFLLINTKVVE